MTTDINKLVTENIDVWTGAILKKNSIGRGSSKKIKLVGINKLRKLILEFALRGKLVAQDEHDEPTSVLLENIAREKELLIATNKIKKQQPLLAILEEEKSFELPHRWEWVRFREIISISSGKALTAKNMNQEGGIPVYGGNGVNGFHDLANVNKRTLVIGRVGFYCGSIHITPNLAWVTDNAFISSFSEENISIDFLALLLDSTNLSKNDSATAQPVISGRKVNPIVLALPPLEEQKRIVSKADELMALCDQLENQTEASIDAHKFLVEELLSTLKNSKNAREFEQSWQRIAEHFDLLFTTEHSIEQLKKAILHLAVMGELTQQDTNDELASKCLERIAKEKAQLIKDKVIKKSKNQPPIAENEYPFPIPGSWEWCRLPDVGELNRGKSKHRPRNDPKLYKDGTIPLVQTGDVARANGVVQTYTALYNQEGLAQSKLWGKGTLCITIAANIADTAVLGFDACFPDSVVGFDTYDELNVKYFDFFIRTAKENLEKYAPSTAQKNINLEILSNVLFPLPPRNEMERIIEKIEGLFVICEQLKVSINNAQTTQVHLAQAVVEQALN